MASRTTGPADDIEFDLAGLLWGDLPLVAPPPSAAQNELAADPPPSDLFSPPLMRDGDPPIVAPAVREPSPIWDAISPRDQEAAAPTAAETEATDDAVALDDEAVEFTFDLDALAAMADLADAVDDEADPARFDLAADVEAPLLEERRVKPLSDRLDQMSMGMADSAESQTMSRSQSAPVSSARQPPFGQLRETSMPARPHVAP